MNRFEKKVAPRFGAAAKAARANTATRSSREATDQAEAQRLHRRAQEADRQATDSIAALSISTLL